MHYERGSALTPDEQEAESVRYAYEPLILIPLRSGRFAILGGWNPRPLLHICEPCDFVDWLAENADAQWKEREARRTAAAELEIEIDFSNLELRL